MAGVPVTVLSQHFARMHHTIVTASAIDGPAVLRSASRAAFLPLLARAVAESPTTPEALADCLDLFAASGLGRLHASGSGFDSPSAHTAHAWIAACGPATAPVCALTEGFLEAALAVVGRPAAIREVACIAAGAPHCRFEADGAQPFAIAPPTADGDGLHTAYGQSVATLPASLLGRIGHDFLVAMDAKGQIAMARDLLAYDSEEAVLCTFAGVLRSREWTARYGDRREGRAVLEALLDVARELGWGPWRLEAFAAAPRVRLSAPPPQPCLDGRHDPSVALASGAAAGLCELVLCEGALDERFGALEVSATVGDGGIDISVGADEAGWIPGGLAA